MIHDRRAGYYAALLAAFLLLKLAYTQADSPHLLWLLGPTNALVGSALGSDGVFSPAQGFVHAGWGIRIDKSCSGFGFWLMSSTLLSWAAIRRGGPRPAAGLLLVLPLLGYLLTLLANTSRILTAVWLLHVLPAPLRQLGWLHEAEGALVYLFFLVAGYGGFTILHAKYALTRAQSA